MECGLHFEYSFVWSILHILKNLLQCVHKHMQERIAQV